MEAISSHQRFVCGREIQHSIADSSKQLVEDKIHQFGLSAQFKITDQEIIYPATDTLFVFRGLLKHTVSSVKSMEGFTRLWLEEAQTISQKSLDIATPTFREPGSQIWASWNPIKATDPIDVLFNENKDDPDFALIEVNYYDNPWFPDVLRKDMERDKRRDPDKYAHVWLGKYQRRSEAAVFRNWTVQDFETPANARFYFGADWGFSIDPTVLIRCWIDKRTLYVDAEAYQVGCEIDRTPALFDKAPDGVTNWRPREWQITADSARPETIDYVKRHGYPRIVPALKGPSSVMDGIEFLKSYDIVVHERCKHVIDELAAYSFKTDPKTEEILPVLADKKNHCIAEGALVACLRGDVPIESVTTDDMVLTRGGYRRVLFSGQTDADRKTVIVKTTVGSVKCTPDHEIWTQRGFVRADALRYGDEVIGASAKLVRGVVLTVCEAGTAKRVYDLTVEEHHEFFADGVLVSNCIDALRYALESLRRSQTINFHVPTVHSVVRALPQ